MMEYLLGIDQGTSGCKMTIFNSKGNVVAETLKTYPTFYGEHGEVEQDCNDWWIAIMEGIKEMLETSDIDAKQIKGIGVDGISWACIPVDQEGKVLCKTMIWLDRRATKEAEWMKKTVGEEALIALSGNPVDACYMTPKMLWLKENKPEVYSKTHKFLQSNSYIVYQLTGVMSQDYSQGYAYHFFDISKGQLDKDIARQLGISIELIPPFYHSHEVVGHVTKKAAFLTGLAVGTPVVAGGLDAACCTLGAGVIHVGQTQEQGGQAGGMSICLDQPVIHPKLILGYHVVPNHWLLQGGTTGGGGTLNWFNRELGYKEEALAKDEDTNPFVIMSQEAGEIPAGSDGVLFLPYMKGERSPLWNGDAKGVYYGLGYDKTRSHMIRSTMEGVAYSLKHNLDTAKEVNVYTKTLTSVGGSSNSLVWTQIKSDVTGKRIEVPYSDHATTLGAAILAGVGTGVYKDFQEAVKTTVKVLRVHEPNDDHVKTYRESYEEYLKLSCLMTSHMW
ncbi:xylulokinase [Vallitalea okinawensis]|uniref:xylulokinase n=1 Tax=Vallitalea okinawensis TaxID=2078660 RepID=UPI000CFD1853|nr:FGGY-family carbohydrate kinase [Vallitalea okinawensis]